jgi:hypothetical protein
MDQPQKFAAYKIDAIPLSLGRRGDTPAEANHASIIAHIGSGAPRALQEHVKCLLVRHHEVSTKHRTQEIRHRNQCEIRSSWAYENLWLPEKTQACSYQRKELIDGSIEVTRIGTDSGRVIVMGERCPCTTRLSMGIQCRHEIVVNQHRFMKDFFEDRHHQECALPRGFYDDVTVAEDFTVNFPSNGDTDGDERRNGDDRSENALLPCNGIDDFEQRCQGVDQSVHSPPSSDRTRRDRRRSAASPPRHSRSIP